MALIPPGFPYREVFDFLQSPRTLNEIASHFNLRKSTVYGFLLRHQVYGHLSVTNVGGSYYYKALLNVEHPIKKNSVS